MPYRSERLARRERVASETRAARAQRSQEPPVAHARSAPPVRPTTIAASLLALALAGSVTLLGVGTGPGRRAPQPAVADAQRDGGAPSPWAPRTAPEGVLSSPSTGLGGLGALGALAGGAPPLGAALERQGLGGFVPLEVADSTRSARVLSSALADATPSTACSVRFAADAAGCSAEIRCDGHTLYASGEHGLACVRGLGGEVPAWDASAHLSFSFEPDRVRVYDTTTGAAAQLLELDLGAAPASILMT